MIILMNDSTLTLVLMAGLPGSGKSTLARELSDRLHWRHIEKDMFRDKLIQQGFKKEEVGELAYERAFDCVYDELLISRTSVILDSSALYEVTIRNALNIVSIIAGVQLKVILCVADQEIRKKRVKKRPQSQTPVNVVDPSTKDEYLLYYEHLPKNILTLFTDQPLDKCVDEAIRYLMSSHCD